MKIKPVRSIAALLGQLQPIEPGDAETLRALSTCIKAMRAEQPNPTRLFPLEQRSAIAAAMSDGIADILDAHIANARREQWKADVAAARAPKADARKLDPAVAQARADKARAVLEAQAFKRRIKDLIDAIEMYQRLAQKAQEPEGSEPDNDKRRKVMAPLIPPVQAACAALHAAAIGGAKHFDTDTKEIVEQTLPRFETTCERWMTQKGLASKEFSPAKFTTIDKWLVTLRSLTRDATETIRELKA